jgi:hypothetical protein
MPRFEIPWLPKFMTYLISAGVTFTLVCIGWVVFRAQSMSDAYIYLSGMVTDIGIPESRRAGMTYVLIAVAIDLIWRKDTRLETVGSSWLSVGAAQTCRWAVYVCMFWAVIVSMANRSGVQQFIYFQF